MGFDNDVISKACVGSFTFHHGNRSSTEYQILTVGMEWINLNCGQVFQVVLFI